MYLEHFGLATNPFGLSPKLDFLYRSGAFEESIAHLLYGLDNSEAIVMITGPIGAGKTMAIQSFLSHLGSHFHFALVTNTRLTSLELLKLVLEDLEVSFPERPDKSDLLIRFKDFLIESGREGKRVLIVIDEAQNLDADVLEEIRLLTNLGQGEGQPVQVILLGQPELEAKVNADGLAQLRQRIRVHYHLEPLSRQELGSYIRHRMSVAGCEKEVFENKALDRIFQLSGGIPRLVNSLAGDALLATFVAGKKTVSDAEVTEQERMRPTGPRTLAQPEPAPRPKATPAPVSPRKPDPIDEPESPAPEPARPLRSIENVSEIPAPVERDRHAARPRRARRWLVAAVLVVTFALLYLSGMLSEPAASVQAWYQQMVAPDVRPAQQEEIVQAPPPTSEPAVEEESTEAVNTEAEDLPVAEPQESDPPDSTPQVAAVGGAETQRAQAETVQETRRPAADPVTKEAYFVHISSFLTNRSASEQLAALNEKHLRGLTRQVMVDGRDWYRVLVGPFTTRDSARVAAEQLKTDGMIEYYMIQTMAVTTSS